MSVNVFFLKFLWRQSFKNSKGKGDEKRQNIELVKDTNRSKTTLALSLQIESLNLFTNVEKASLEHENFRIGIYRIHPLAHVRCPIIKGNSSEGKLNWVNSDKCSMTWRTTK